ncbi:unnamed protein product, partial [marine sediment metagenome]
MDTPVLSHPEAGSVVLLRHNRRDPVYHDADAGCIIDEIKAC